MNDIVTFIDELIMLKTMNKDEEVDCAIQRLLDKYNGELKAFEQSIEMDYVRYNPLHEV